MGKLMARTTSQAEMSVKHHFGEEFDTLIASMAAGVIIYGNTGKIIRINEFARNILNYSADDCDESLTNRQQKLNLHKSDSTLYELGDTPLDRALRGATILNEEMLLKQSPTKTKWISATLSPIRHSDNDYHGVVFIFTDITERKQREEENARIHARLTITNELTAIAISSLDITEVAQKVLVRLGQRFALTFANIFIENEELGELIPTAAFGLPEKFFHSIPPFKTDSGYASARVFRTGRPVILEDAALAAITPLARNSMKATEEAVGSTVGSAVIMPLTTCQKTFGTLNLFWAQPRTFSPEDIKFYNSIANEVALGMQNARLYEAERKKARELAENRRNLERVVAERTKELHLSEQQHRQMIEVSPDAYFIVADHQILYANPAACSLFGGIDKLTPAHLRSIIADEQYRGLQEKLDKSGQTKVAVRLGEFTIAALGPEARPAVLDVTVVPLTYEGKPAHQYIVRDMTQRKTMEKELARLDRLNMIGEMAAGIGHEVRNPMTSVKGFLQLLANKEEETVKLEYYHLMIDELDRANQIITEFLSLARDRSVELSPACLNSIITSLMPLLTADANKEDKHICLSQQAVPSIPLDEKEIRQLILNLVKNGLEATQPGGSLTIGTYGEKNEVVLFVRDQGSGISPEVFEKLGTPFVTTKDEGAGLGLSVCYSIAHKHRAKIDVTTGPGGTTFFVRFHNKAN
ncbi:MAG TPA: ATP-binding protein [Bacillota bacterium]|nr:ATP-binding protein [Bacillota bacterium]